MNPEYAVPEPTKAERSLIKKIDKHWSRERALRELKAHLQTAIEIELATIPVYLYTYYTVDRKPSQFPDTELSRWADKAGALIMSVAVEEMLHMSLACNILYSLGEDPQLYLRSPGPYPTNLPGHANLGPDHEPMSIPLAQLSFDQLWKFLEIEYPAKADAPPEGSQWETIGQIYSYIRCIIFSDHIKNKDFKVRDEHHDHASKHHQIQPYNYSPNNIDTAWPDAAFDYSSPPPAQAEGSAANVTKFASDTDDHVLTRKETQRERKQERKGRDVYTSALITIENKRDALTAIATIDFQGEGFDFSDHDDPSGDELSHFYKFLTIQSKLQGYPDHDDFLALRRLGNAVLPPPAEPLYGPSQLQQVVFSVPSNPVAASLEPGRKAVADVASALYQYMLIMSETVFRVPPDEQRVYFNRSMHMSMIWLLDKLLQAMRTVPLYSDSVTALPDGTLRLTCPFDNIQLGPRNQAFANLSAMAKEVDQTYGEQPWYTGAGLGYYMKQIAVLPDVSAYWEADNKYAGAPRYPAAPPAQVPNGGPRHACMGLNSCRNQGRTLDNACAGQGYCSTALAYNPQNPQQGQVSDHTCHVLNDCASQGGCGLYGTPTEQDEPGANACRSLGSCATPINAERFSTAGSNMGKSVWLRAREVFKDKVWPALREGNPDLPKKPPSVPGTENDPDLFAYGPTIEWIEDYSDAGMTACGASGLSGAGSCA